jgi:putative DNA primase/helicase
MTQVIIKNDGAINIATGLKADSVIWKNQKIQWSSFVKKLSVAVKTNETFKEYQQASKDEKSSIKDVGGYVGGYLRNGRRKIANILSKSIITLDLDFATLDFWDDFTFLFDNAACLHASHSHSEKAPRYRLILPLSREVAPDEYAAISRKIAGLLGIELFDSTTFETNRLMFWPSVSKDVEYYFQYQDGDWVDPDYYLGLYRDWRDASLWPTSKREAEAVRNGVKKQEDPEEKKGVIGAFCRTYSMQEAIETFLSDVYSEAANGCYTYINGSTSAGLKVYENKFAYSHHGTDPAGGKLCNVFDLVRIHKFAHLDGEGENKSQKAMEDFVRADDLTKRTIAKENFENLKYEFAEDDDDYTADEDTANWLSKMDVDNKGSYQSSANNLNLIFANDARLKGAFKQNIFDGKRYLIKSMPFRKIKETEPLKNVDYSGIRNYIECVYGINAPMKVDDALALELDKNTFHPIQTYLSGLVWDGTKRIEKILIDYFGSPNDLYHREAIRKHLIAAVARVFVPGIKYDYVLTLVGDQGTGKSTFVRKIGKSWTSDSFITVNGNQSFEQLMGAWHVEIAELSGIKKAEIEAVKHYISKQEDIFRPAYMRVPETFKRQCVFWGTTNNAAFLYDPSGNRRFLPVDINNAKVTKSVFDLKDETIDQFWAEALTYWKEGENLYLSEQAEAEAKIQQSEHVVVDERSGIIVEYVNLLLPDKWGEMGLLERRAFLADEDREKAGKVEREFLCVAEVWCECLGREKEDMDRWRTGSINDILRQLEGWQAAKGTKFFALYGKQRYFIRK